MGELEAEVVHEIHVMPTPPAPHWPGQACYCRPEGLKISAPCGHRVVAFIHGTLTEAAKNKLYEDVQRTFQPHHPLAGEN